MYQFFLMLWRLHRLTEAQIAELVAAGRITEAQAAEIIATPK